MSEHVHEWSRGESRMWANRDAVWLCDCGAVAFGDNPPRPLSGLTLKADAFRAGAEAMRAAVLEVCRKLEKENVLRQLVVSHVRALPLPESKE